MKKNLYDKNTLDKAINSCSEGEVPNCEKLQQLINGNDQSVIKGLNAITGMVSKIVLQEIISTNVHSKYDSWKLFEGQKLIAGNGKYFVKKYMNGMVYDSLIGTANYLPAKKNEDGNFEISLFPSPMVEQTVSGVSKYQAQLTYTQSELISYVTTPAKIGELIALMAKETYTVFTMHLYDAVFGTITSYFTAQNFPGKTISDTASKNNYQCAHELNMIVNDMEDYTNKYVIDPTSDNYKYAKVFSSTNPSDLLVLLHPEVMKKFNMGTLPGIFNPANVKFLEHIPKQNFIELARNKYANIYDAANEKLEPSTTETPYIDNKTIILMDKKAFCIMFQFKKASSQSFAANDTMYTTLHYSFTKDIIKFQPACVYKCDNLSKGLSDSLN